MIRFSEGEQAYLRAVAEAVIRGHPVPLDRRYLGALGDFRHEMLRALCDVAAFAPQEAEEPPEKRQVELDFAAD